MLNMTESENDEGQVCGPKKIEKLQKHEIKDS